MNHLMAIAGSCRQQISSTDNVGPDKGWYFCLKMIYSWFFIIFKIFKVVGSYKTIRMKNRVIIFSSYL